MMKRRFFMDGDFLLAGALAALLMNRAEKKKAERDTIPLASSGHRAHC